ncbi:MerR family transcriptional regulator [Halalkalibacter nanhaiisediminis]|uniref:DNA-binding transcriptional MerR regulator n=1 Tax=Halalkalibacter nanhaiisediminis TaxID=688079 RepID=A0A562QT40_9BACI|nr:MerR family transcriptional regulator [Halalkalibacter nanhaiisediminis]TWI59857.1 DNA-binding transcriptional MerR regulator [Halalkalibacter nanhaiisediminis]
MLRIGQVAELSGLSARTIDYYTKKGLLAFKRSNANYRLYPQNVLQSLERIKWLQEQRMSLDEIAETMQVPSDEEVEPFVFEVQEEIHVLQQKLTTLEDAMKNTSQKEKELIYKDITEKLKVVMQRFI